MQQNKYDIYASNLLFTAFASATFLNFFLEQGFFDKRLNTTVYTVLVVFSVLVLIQYYYIRQGKRWAQASFLVLYPLGELVGILGLSKIGSRFHTPLDTFNYVQQTALEVAAWVLIIMSIVASKKAKVRVPEASV